MSESPARLSLAEKLTRLFEVVRAPDGRRHSDEDVARAIAARGGPSISANYVYLLRTGKRDNPTKRHLEALAAFFDVSPAYFFDDGLSAQIAAELDLLSAMRQAGVRDVALRAAELGPRRRQTMLNIMAELARDEAGDEPVPHAVHGGGGTVESGDETSGPGT